MVVIDTGQTVETSLRNVHNIKRMAFDLGQTVIKIAYTSTVRKTRTTDDKQLVDDDKEALHLHCVQVRREYFEDALNFLVEKSSISSKIATFSSTFPHESEQQMIKEKLGLELHRINEMDCLVKGTNFLMSNIESETYNYDHHSTSCKYIFRTIRPSTVSPYLLVNVGTGVSFFKVDSDEQYERLGGSHLGGASLIGISKLIADAENLDEILQMAEDGDHRSIDILVSDIYGSRLAADLSGDIIAGSFGKCKNPEAVARLRQTPTFAKDVVRSLLLMISNQIGQSAVLYAESHNIKSIYFNGYLVRNHPIIMRTFSYAIEFWSQKKISARFLRHEGYTAAIGAFLKGARQDDSASIRDNEGEQYSWNEYFIGCSDLGRFVPTAPLSLGFSAGVLELECAHMQLQPFTLLADSDDNVYLPDEANLNEDEAARTFWIDTMEKSADNVMKKAEESQRHAPGVAERATNFKKKFLKQLKIIREKPHAYGSANVRNLLDLREQLLIEMQFDDSYLSQKTLDNHLALSLLQSTLQYYDSIADDSERLFALSRGLLAGNVFDWGASQVVKIMESQEGLSFTDAVKTIPARPWLIDSYDEFVRSMQQKTYKCAAIFVDNSGADFILGIIPFARELVKRGTKVIIISNLSPALNDLTYKEMLALAPMLCEKDDKLAEAIRIERLIFSHSGQGSPCLDLRKVNSELNEAMLKYKVDLIVIEGMGRALHTNLNARFKCDSLKAAVIKTQWLADRMGGELFSVVFKFEHGYTNLSNL